MQFNEDKRIKISVPFLKGKTILYVDNHIGTSRYFIEEFKEELQYKFKKLGYTFLYLPEVCERLSPQLLEYMFPGQEDHPFAETMYQRIQEMAGLNDQAGFIYKESRLFYFHAIDGKSGIALDADIDEFLDFIQSRQAEGSSGVRFSIRNKDLDPLPRRSLLHKAEREISIEGFDSYKEDPLDPKTQEILDAWDDIERRFDISINDLAVLLGYRTNLSRLLITPSNQIFLADWKNRPEVKLDDLTKALYFFYLKHPEGVVFKDLPDHEKEVLNIYLDITGRDDINAIRGSVSTLCASYSDGRNSCVSRIRKAFRDIVGDNIAKKYYIDGPQGGLRKVAIDRDLVIWKH